jgi:hypothetical protein
MDECDLVELQPFCDAMDLRLRLVGLLAWCDERGLLLHDELEVAEQLFLRDVDLQKVTSG